MAHFQRFFEPGAVISKVITDKTMMRQQFISKLSFASLFVSLNFSLKQDVN